MIMGPFAAWCMKHVDKLWEGKIKPGFEMLVNNFSAGILAAALAVVGYFVFGPPIETVSNAAGNGVDWLVDNSLLPLASLLIEPAKVLFLNNAINHGVLTPLGIQQAAENGKSILFLLEANPGPGAGLLIAYSIFGTGVARNTAPAALIIQFFGGIHEIYFPFVLLKPLTILATIAGGMVGILTLVIFGAGLRAPAAPGSIIAVYAQTPGNSLVGVTLSVLLAAATSFLVGSVILRASRRRDEATWPPRPPRWRAQGQGELGLGVLNQLEAEEAQARTERVEPIRKIVFACDAGMGSSAMGASVLRNKLKKAGFEDVSVVNVAIANLDDSYDLVVTHQDLTLRARDRTPSAQHVSVTNFMASPKYDEIVHEVQQTNAPGAPTPPAEPRRGGGLLFYQLPSLRAVADRQRSSLRMSDVLTLSQIRMPGVARSKDEAIREAGEILVDAGAVTPPTSTRCSTGSGRSPPTWATTWPSRTAPTSPRSRSSGRRCR